MLMAVCEIVEGLDKAINIDKNALIANVKFDKSSTAQDVSDTLDWINDNIGLVSQSSRAESKTEEDDMNRYTFLKNSESFFGSRVSHWLQKKFHRDQTPEQRAKFNAKYKVMNESGTFIHDLNENIGRIYVEAKENGIKPDYTRLRRIAMMDDSKGYKFDKPEHFDYLVGNVQRMIDEIYKMNDQINEQKGLTGSPFIKFEQIIADPVKDLAGTMDVVAIFQDKSAIIYDYKTIRVKAAHRSGNNIISHNFIHHEKVKGYKKQQSLYKTMLTKNWGVTQVRGTRIVPIWVEHEYNAKKDVYEKTIKHLQTGQQQVDYLSDLLVTAEKIGVSKIDEYINSRHQAIAKLNDRIKTNPEGADGYMARITVINNAIKDFILKEDINAVLAEVGNSMHKVKSDLLIGNKVELADLNDLITDGNNLINFITDTAKRFSQEANKNTSAYRSIQAVFTERAEDVSKLTTILGELEQEVTNRVTAEIAENDYDIVNEDGSIMIHDDDISVKIFGRQNQATNPFIQAFNRLNHVAYDNIRENTKRDVDRISAVEDKAYAYMKNRGMNHADLVRLFVNEKTENLNNKLNSSFYDAQSKAKDNKDINFFLKNFKIREGYEADYKRRLAKHISDVNALYPDNPSRVEKEIDSWVKTNDLSLDGKGRPNNPQAWMRNRYHWREKSEAAFRDYMSPAYKEISLHPPLKEYFDTIVSMNQDLRTIAGVDSSVIPATFIPHIKQGVVEAFKTKGIRAAMGESLDEILSIVEESDSDFENRQASENKIPLLFTNPFRDRDGNRKRGVKSYDFGRSMVLFAKAVHTYRAMSDIEAQTLAIRDVMNNQAIFYNKDADGNQLVDGLGNFVTKKTIGSTEAENILNQMIDYHLYGIRVSNDNDKTITIGGKKVSRNKFILQAKNYMSLKSLGLGFVPGTAAYAAGQVQAILEGQKGGIYTGQQYKDAKKLSWSSDTAPTYWALAYDFGVYSGDVLEYESTREGKNATGSLSGNETSRINRFVNSRMLMKPFAQGDMRIDAHIANAMALNYGVDLDNGNVRRMKNLKGKNAISISELYSYDPKKGGSMDKLDPKFHQKVRIAFRNAVREGQQNIKGSISEEDINFAQLNLVTNLMMHFKTWMPGIMKERFGSVQYNRYLDIAEVGRYRGLGSEIAKDMADSGRSLQMLMDMTKNSASILAAEIPRWFGGKGYQVDRTRAKLAYELAKQDAPHKLRDMTLDDFIEARQTAIRAAVAEFSIMLLLLATTLALAGDWDDDGTPLGRENWALRQFTKITNRVYTEVASFVPTPFSILELNKIVGQGMPITGIVRDFGLLAANTLEEGTNFIFNIDDPNDKTPAGYYSRKMIPGFYRLSKLMEMFKQDERATR